MWAEKANHQSPAQSPNCCMYQERWEVIRVLSSGVTLPDLGLNRLTLAALWKVDSRRLKLGRGAICFKMQSLEFVGFQEIPK